MSEPAFLYTEDEFRGLTDEVLEALQKPEFHEQAIPTKEEPQLPDFKGLTPATSKDVYELFNHVIDIELLEQEAQVLIQAYTSLILDEWLVRFRQPVKTKAGILGHIIHIIQVRSMKVTYQERLKKMFKLTQDMTKSKDITQALLEVLHFHAFKLLVWAPSMEQMFLPAEEENPGLHQIAIMKEFQRRSYAHLLVFDYPRVLADNDTSAASPSVRQMLYGLFNPAVHSRMTTDQGLNIVRVLSAAAKNLLEASPGPSPNPDMLAHLKQVVKTRVEAFPYEMARLKQDVTTQEEASPYEEEKGHIYVPDFIAMAQDMIRLIRNFIVNKKFSITIKQAEAIGFIFDQLERIPGGWNPLSFRQPKPKPQPAKSTDGSTDAEPPTGFDPGLSKKATFDEIFRLERVPLPKSKDCHLCKAKLEKGSEVMFLECKHSFHPLCLALRLKERGVCPDCQIPINARLKFTTGYDEQQRKEKIAKDGVDTTSIKDHYLLNATEEELLSQLPPRRDQAPYSTALKFPYAAKTCVAPYSPNGVIRPELDYTRLSIYAVDSLATHPMHLPPAIRLVDSNGNRTDIPDPDVPEMLERLNKIPGINNTEAPSTILLKMALQLEKTRKGLGLPFVHCDDIFRNTLPDLVMLRKYQRVAKNYDSDVEIIAVVEKPSAKKKSASLKRKAAKESTDAPTDVPDEPIVKKSKVKATSKEEDPKKLKEKRVSKKDKKRASKKNGKKASRKTAAKGSKKSKKSKK